MLLKPKTPSTHTSDAFVDFAYDLLDFTVVKYGFVWVKPEDYERGSPKLFKEWFGDIVILYRERNYSHHFEERFSYINELESADDILLHVAVLRESIFQGNIPLMEFIVYCAFLLDLALICLRLEDPHLLYNIVDDTTEVFHRYIKPYFTIVGGWYSLYRVAEQYFSYVTSEPQSNPVVSVAKEDLVQNKSACTGEF